MQQHFELGKWLAKRYRKIIGPKYDPNQIYIRATDMDRTIVSALSNLAGMFPPEGYQKWNPDLDWQPIPVHSVPNEFDDIIGTAVYKCPAFDVAALEVYKSPAFQKIINKAKPLLAYICEKEKSTISALMFSIITDTLYIEHIRNMK